MFDFGYEPLPHDDSQYFKDIDTRNVYIPIGDVAAYHTYPKYHWVYNKIRLCEAQNIYAFPDGDENPPFPIFRKPICNLYGMSAGAEPIFNKEQYNKDYKPGYFLMPLLEGEHYTTDVAISVGNIVWVKSMLCHKDEKGSFLMFEIMQTPSKIQNIINHWVNKHFNQYTGILNFETIGLSIIECHLRMSIQFVDLYGEGWLDAVVNLYDNKEWNFVDRAQVGYSIPLRVHTPGIYSFPEQSIKDAKKCCNSIQIFVSSTYNVKDDNCNDIHSYRLAVVNGFNQTQCEHALKILSNNIIKS